MCAYCSGSSGSEGLVDEELTQQWKSVLQVFHACRAKGALPLARTRRRNGDVNERRAQRARLAAPPTSLAPSEDVPFATHGEANPRPIVGPRARRRKRRINPSKNKMPNHIAGLVHIASRVHDTSTCDFDIKFHIHYI